MRNNHRNTILRRAVRAGVIALLLIGSGYAWHKASSERTAARAEQARQSALRMTPAKLEALKREAAIEAAAKAYAEKVAAEKQAQSERVFATGASAHSVH